MCTNIHTNAGKSLACQWRGMAGAGAETVETRQVSMLGNEGTGGRRNPGHIAFVSRRKVCLCVYGVGVEGGRE